LWGQSITKALTTQLPREKDELLRLGPYLLRQCVLGFPHTPVTGRHGPPIYQLAR